MNRRDFFAFVGVGLIASSLPVAVVACSSETKESKASDSPTAASKGWQKIGTTAELDKKGQLLVEKSPVGPVLVVGTSKKKNLIAVNPTCTHKGCTVTWQAKNNNFACPCHDSDFGTDGKVLKGPADKPLKTYQAKIEGNAILVQ
jgi:cytochrome b6-f complex iron-sulfur subunit